MGDGYEVSGALLVRGLGLVYLVAFASLFTQVPALFGCDGLEPVGVFLERMVGHWSSTGAAAGGGLAGAWGRFLMLPTALWFTRELSDLRPEVWMDAACLLGMACAALLACGCRWRSLLAANYLLYLSMFQVGQTFLSFQWDILLLEAGLLAIFLAPFARPIPPRVAGRSGKEARGRRDMTVEAVVPSPVVLALRLLLVKLMVLSGIVKIVNGGHWHRLSAMAYHYATTCLPTPLSFAFHQLPALVHELEVAICLLVEVPAALLLVLPLPRVWRVTGAVVQIGLQLLIQLTGNYTFFNLLTALLCLTAVDDEAWAWLGFGRQGGERKETSGGFWRVLNGLFHFALMYLLFTGILSKLLLVEVSKQTPGQLAAKFAAALMPDQAVTWKEFLSLLHLKLSFSTARLQKFLNFTVPLLVAGLSAIFAFDCIRFFWRALTSSRRCVRTYLTAVLYSLLVIAAVTTVFLANVPNFTRLTSGPVNISGLDCELPINSVECASHALYPAVTAPVLSSLNARLRPWAGSSSYGLFRSMTGVGPKGEVARPELIVEGFNGTHWLPYEFRYKPGDVSRSPPWVAPHQPRLDWQMWFAALGNYDRNPWLLHWIYKLLVHSPTARDLIDDEHSPFRDAPPQAVRVEKYVYDFAMDEISAAVGDRHRDWSGKSPVDTGEWWRRHREGQWLQPVTVANLEQFIAGQNYPLEPAKDCALGGWPAPAKDVLGLLRNNTLGLALGACFLALCSGVLSVFGIVG
mmetsp:Transcript_8029/g.33792  ORF Transcript_8029/g.33792 Transcript_8029/m.33792 type:complete len:746 (-) Transcript_8029:47-2284(-)